MSIVAARCAHLILIVALSVLTTGCSRIAEAIIEAGLDEMLENFDADRGGPSSNYTPTAPAPPSGPYINYVAFLTGTESGNVVCYFPNSTAWDVARTYSEGESPIGIATMADNGIAIATNRGVSIPGLPIVTLDRLNAETGAATIGVITAASDDETESILVAATTEDDESLLIRIDSDTGAILDTTRPRPATRIEGLLVSGDLVVAAEAPDGAIVCYDLSESQPERIVLIEPEQTAGQPAGMTIGASGNLFVASRDEPVIQEFDLDNGVLVSTIRIPEIEAGGLRDVVYAPIGDRYFVTAGTDAIYELDGDGELVGVHTQEELAGAASITLVER